MWNFLYNKLDSFKMTMTGLGAGAGLVFGAFFILWAVMSLKKELFFLKEEHGRGIQRKYVSYFMRAFAFSPGNWPMVEMFNNNRALMYHYTLLSLCVLAWLMCFAIVFRQRVDKPEEKFLFVTLCLSLGYLWTNMYIAHLLHNQLEYGFYLETLCMYGILFMCLVLMWSAKLYWELNWIQFDPDSIKHVICLWFLFFLMPVLFIGLMVLIGDEAQQAYCLGMFLWVFSTDTLLFISLLLLCFITFVEGDPELAQMVPADTIMMAGMVLWLVGGYIILADLNW